MKPKPFAIGETAMSRDRHSDDSSPGRGRYDNYYDDYPEDDFGRSQRSGAVTGVAVINFVVGGLVLLFGLCGFLGALVEASEGWRPRGGFAGSEFAIVFVIILFTLIWSIGAIIAGVGVINRRQWGRVLTLILGGIAVVKGLLAIALAVVLMSSMPRGAFDDDRILGFMVLALISFLYIGYGIWTYVVLLNSQYSAEFG
jgi:hypothetical protein